VREGLQDIIVRQQMADLLGPIGAGELNIGVEYTDFLTLRRQALGQKVQSVFFKPGGIIGSAQLQVTRVVRAGNFKVPVLQRDLGDIQYAAAVAHHLFKFPEVLVAATKPKRVGEHGQDVETVRVGVDAGFGLRWVVDVLDAVMISEVS
jgi:hypothetical protein